MEPMEVEEAEYQAVVRQCWHDQDQQASVQDTSADQGKASLRLAPGEKRIKT